VLVFAPTSGGREDVLGEGGGAQRTLLLIRTRLSAAIHAEYLSGTNFYKAVSLAGVCVHT